MCVAGTRTHSLIPYQELTRHLAASTLHGTSTCYTWTRDIDNHHVATLFIEMAPGHVSTHLVAELFPDVRAVSIADQGLRYATVVAAREKTSEPYVAVN